MPFDFTVANLKDRANHAKTSSISKFQETREKYSSPPLARTKFVAEDGLASKLPPPPPQRSSTSASTSSFNSIASPPRSDAFARSPPPPIFARGSKPSLASSPSLLSQIGSPGARDEIDWTNLSPEDKHVFFSWLDEFFARYLHIPVEPRSVHDTIKHVMGSSQNDGHTKSSPAPPPSAPALPSRSPPSVASDRGPPPIKHSTRPTLPSSYSSDIHTTPSFTLSYPPPTTHGSAAADLAQYFLPSVPWTSSWFTTDSRPLPPPLTGRKDIAWTASFQWSSTQKTVSVGILFADLSLCFYTVSFPTNSPNPNPSTVTRHVEYLPCPNAWDRDSLITAHETYGDSIASFAESYLGTNQFCARGECWDLANEALNNFATQFSSYVDKPVPSIARTHGHLIFSGKAFGKGNTVGIWRGGDDRVRRGDIVEWRSVRINTVNAPPGSYATLGDPDHTAIITRDSIPQTSQGILLSPRDGENLTPVDLDTLEVVEQSVGSPPDKKVYDLRAFEQGEIWIYRPVSMKAYLGTELSARPPEGVRTLKV